MTVDYSKPLRAKYEIEGVTSQFELQMAGDILMKIYNATCNITNNGGIETFNRNWDREHPDWVHRDNDTDTEYVKAYCRYFKSIADEIAVKCGSPYKLREFEPVLLNFDKGYVYIYGYKEH